MKTPKKFPSKIIGLSIDEFDALVNAEDPQLIKLQRTSLIPVLKTGDEGALASIFLSSLRLIKEFREGIFQDIKLRSGGKYLYYREVDFLGKEKCSGNRVDGLILQVKRNVIVDAVIFEMKNSKNSLNKEDNVNQIKKYCEVAKDVGITKVVTVSNDFVSSPSESPIALKKNEKKGCELYHLSWTYIRTRAQLLLFQNSDNIKDEDQVEIMREVLNYVEDPKSGVLGFNQMKDGWKQVVKDIKEQMPLDKNDPEVFEAINSWYAVENGLALMLSRKLGVLVHSSKKKENSNILDYEKLKNEHYLHGSLRVKNSVSDIDIMAEFERRILSFTVKVLPNQAKGSVAKVSDLRKQFEKCEKRAPEVFNLMEDYIYVEANIKGTRKGIKVRLSELEDLKEQVKSREVTDFRVIYAKSSSFSTKSFIADADLMLINFYKGVVQHMTNWTEPAAKM
jgi:hypothetical protein